MNDLDIVREIHEEPNDLQRWLADHPIDQQLLWKGGAIHQSNFVEKHLVALVGHGLYDPASIVSVISTHTSKSVALPVYQLARPDLGLRFIMRDNFYNWKLSVISDRDVVVDLRHLCETEPPREPEYTGDCLHSAYFEGFPHCLVFGYYSANRRQFSAEFHGNASIWTALYLIMKSFGVGPARGAGVAVPHSDYPASEYTPEVQDMIFVRDTLGRLLYAGHSYQDLPSSMKGLMPGPPFLFQPDGRAFSIVPHADGTIDVATPLGVRAGDLALTSSDRPDVATGGTTYMVNGRYAAWALLHSIQVDAGVLRPHVAVTQKEHRKVLDEERRAHDAEEVVKSALESTRTKVQGKYFRLNLGDVARPLRETSRSLAAKAFEAQRHDPHQTQDWWKAVHAAARTLEADPAWQAVRSLVEPALTESD